MRVIIFGASGRVGTHLVESVIADPGLELAGAVVSPDSTRLGQPVGEGVLEYRVIDPGMNARCDVIVDFSTPAASIELQQTLAEKPLPVVIGTTGLAPDEQATIEAAARRRPILMSANFAIGFEPFLRAVTTFARLQPGAVASIEEVYHARKKAAPSGTSLRLARELSGAVAPGMPGTGALPPVSVLREGQTVGINTVRFDLGSVDVETRFVVRSLAAYAQGALAAARWLVESSPGNGLFSLTDMLSVRP
jgi:4-hydroxy-tetrahydrodipicolinate reductase